MLKKTVEYVNFNDEKVKEDFYFNLTKAEIMEMQLEEKGGLAERIQRVVDAKDTTEIVKIFKELLVKSYGIKSADGKSFVKNDRIREEFESSAAYSEIYMELATNAEAASAFVNGILPKQLVEAANKQLEAKQS